MPISLLAFAALALQETTPPRTPGDPVKEAADSEWTEIAADDLMILEFANGERTVIQLNPAFAPVHVTNIKTFTRTGYWDGATIYRVVDNWVTQWGNGGNPAYEDEDKPLPGGAVDNPPKEYDRPGKGIHIRPLGSDDPYSQMAGFENGWPVAYHADGRVGPTYCYGYVGVARGADPDTGSGSELFTAIGTPPRRLDRNYALVGRVIDGMANLSALPRGTDGMGVYADNQPQVAITRTVLASDLPVGERPRYRMLTERSPKFSEYIFLASHRYDYGVGSAGAALCAVPVPVEEIED